MNLREAIEAGAQRVDGRCRNDYVLIEGEVVLACALGAAYLGCHPDADPRELGGLSRRLETRILINEWLEGIFEPMSVQPGYVTSANDWGLPRDASFDDVIAHVARTSPDALSREVCDEPA